MIRGVVFCLIVSICSVSVQAQDKEKNHCHDPESWTEWNEQLKTGLKDMEFQTLHALRLGLCLKVERGDLTLDKATSIFEQARSTLIQKRREEKRANSSPPVL